MPESPKTPDNEPFSLFVTYNREAQRETHIDPRTGLPRFTMPMIDLLYKTPDLDPNTLDLFAGKDGFVF